MNYIETPTRPQTKRRTWHLWERSSKLPAFEFQKRDEQIVEIVFRHRFVQKRHIHALLGGSKANLAHRCRLLWEHKYLERPVAIRATSALTEEMTYGLGPEGARLLQRLRPELRIAELEWSETPRKQTRLRYIDHQLGISDFMVALQLACDRREVKLRWGGHFEDNRYFKDKKKRDLFKAPGDKHRFIPDAHFVLEMPNGAYAHHLLELDRGNRTEEQMYEKFNRYYRWWKAGGPQRAFGHKHLRVLVIAERPDHVPLLRRAGQKVGRNRQYSKSWHALMFSHLATFDLEHPDQVLQPIFLYADEDAPLALV